jgi:hypothetical protein
MTPQSVIAQLVSNYTVMMLISQGFASQLCPLAQCTAQTASVETDGNYQKH